MFETMSRAIDSDGTGISFGSQHVGRPLLTPDEVRTLREDLQLLFLAGQRPIGDGVELGVQPVRADALFGRNSWPQVVLRELADAANAGMAHFLRSGPIDVSVTI
ncbi:hypothetical protein J2Y58_004046 [Sphingomonas sp. BE138]|nr:hypothetical protein [Sphingomonas sp. BE138]